MFNIGEYQKRTDLLPHKVPWAALVAPGVVLQKDALVQKTVRFRGPDLDSSSDDELVYAMTRLNTALKRLDSGWALFCEAQRVPAAPYPPADWIHPAAWLLDYERRRRSKEAGARFESQYYLTFVWRLPDTREKKALRFFYDDPASRSESQGTLRDLESFQASVREILDLMRAVFCEVEELDDDATLTYLHSTISIHRHKVLAPETPMYLDALLPDVPYTAGDIPLLDDHFIPTITITGFPGTTTPGILRRLDELGIAYRWMTRWICLGRDDAFRELQKYRKRWWQKRKSLGTLLKEEAVQQESALVDNAAANNAADADAALQELGADLVAFGYLTTTVTLADPDLDEVRRKIQLVTQVVQSEGFVVRRESLHGEEAWLSSLPGHVYANVRRPIISSANLAHMLPISAVWAGNECDTHVRKITGVAQAHIHASTTGSTPFRLNLNVDDVGHTFVVGPTGAGKSTFLELAALQWLKFPHAQIIFFDRDRSARAATHAVGGNYYEPGSERAPLAFQPLAGIDDRPERRWATEFVLSLLAAQNIPDSPQTKIAVDTALEHLSSSPPKERTLSMLVDFLGATSLRDALRPYTLPEGIYGQIFDADHDDLRTACWTMVEMGQLMALGQAAVIPALEYLFHRFEARFDGRPTLLIIDEAWLALKHQTFVRRLEAWLTTLRKKNVYVIFATTEVAHAVNSPILSTILSACQTKIFLPDEDARNPAMARTYQEFGLTETEIDILASAQKKKHYYYRSVKGRRLFTLDLGPVALALTGFSSPSDHAFLDELERRGQDPSEYAGAILAHRGIEARQLLADARAKKVLRS